LKTSIISFVDRLTLGKKQARCKSLFFQEFEGFSLTRKAGAGSRIDPEAGASLTLRVRSGPGRFTERYGSIRFSSSQRVQIRGDVPRLFEYSLRVARHQSPPRRRIPFFVAGLAAALLLAVVGLSIFGRFESADGEAGREESRRLVRLEQLLREREEELAAARHSLAKVERQLATERKKPVEPAGRVLATRSAEAARD
jgi:hypothetical protein